MGIPPEFVSLFVAPVGRWDGRYDGVHHRMPCFSTCEKRLTGRVAICPGAHPGGTEHQKPNCTQGSKHRRLASRKPAGPDFRTGRNTMTRRVARGTLLAATLALLATTAIAQQQDAPAP